MGSRIKSYAVEFLSCILESICCETVYNISTSGFSHKIILLQLLFLFFIYSFFFWPCAHVLSVHVPYTCLVPLKIGRRYRISRQLWVWTLRKNMKERKPDRLFFVPCIIYFDTRTEIGNESFFSFFLCKWLICFLVVPVLMYFLHSVEDQVQNVTQSVFNNLSFPYVWSPIVRSVPLIIFSAISFAVTRFL